MYFSDLSQRANSLGLLYVGWLEKGQPFTQGVVSDDFKHRLLVLCAKSVKTRGFHSCTFCTENQERKTYLLKEKSVSMGSGFFELRGKHWKTYMAPDLIYHYVEEHNYKPPGEFIEAVLHPRSWFLTFDFAILTILLCVGVLAIASNHLPLATLFLMLVPISLSFLIIMGAIVIIRFRKNR
jgi:hypothetical protein